MNFRNDEFWRPRCLAIRFTGTLHSATVDVSGELIVDTDSEMRMALARQ